MSTSTFEQRSEVDDEPRSLDDLLAEVTDENPHDEIDTGSPVGREQGE